MLPGMRLPFARTAPPQPDVPVTAPRLRYGVRVHDDLADRADLTCAACHRVIAYAIRADRVEADSAYYLDAHVRFCVAVAADA